MMSPPVHLCAVKVRPLTDSASLSPSLQFAVLMWILTYVGAFFNGLTLLILGESQRQR